MVGFSPAVGTGVYALTFIASLLTLWMLYRNLPVLLSEDGREVSLKFDKWPTTTSEWAGLATRLNAYKEQHYRSSLSLFLAAYLFKQTFSVPGSAAMNILAGILWGFWPGLVIVCCTTTCGACLCYFLSKAMLGRFVREYFPHWIRYLKDKVHTQSSKVLFLDLLALRVIPFTPNWALNLCLPHLAVPLHIFASTVFIGLLPYNFICVEAGTMATNLRNPSDMIKDPSTLLRLCLVGLALMTPRIITKFSRYNRPTQPLL